MYLNHLSLHAANAHSQDMHAEAEQDRRLALVRRPQPLAPAMRAAARRMIQLFPTKA